jgi:uncharacterized protein YciI
MKKCCVGIVGLALAFLAGTLIARQPPGMDCQEVVAVIFDPGPNAEAFSQHVEGHLDFLLAQMKAGKPLYAGPFHDKAAGLSLFKLTDAEEVEKLIKQDPVVAEQVLSYRIEKWRMCQLAKED